MKHLILLFEEWNKERFSSKEEQRDQDPFDVKFESMNYLKTFESFNLVKLNNFSEEMDFRYIDSLLITESAGDDIDYYLRKVFQRIKGVPIEKKKTLLIYALTGLLMFSNSNKILSVLNTDSFIKSELISNPELKEVIKDKLEDSPFKDATTLKNIITPEDKSFENVMNILHHADLFIGLSSGISWLNWALGKRSVMISNFTDKDHEFKINCTRIINESVCHGCWNNPIFKFNKGDWNWCPEHEDTPRQFECHKTISALNVFNKINNLLILK